MIIKDGGGAEDGDEPGGVPADHRQGAGQLQGQAQGVPRLRREQDRPGAVPTDAGGHLDRDRTAPPHKGGGLRALRLIQQRCWQGPQLHREGGVLKFQAEGLGDAESNYRQVISIKHLYKHFMLRRQNPSTDKTNDLFRDDSLHPQPRPKISNLTPYLTEIEKRKKQRSHLQHSKKNVHESSSKSFRIKDRSLTSLHKEVINRRQPPKKMQIPSHNLELRPQKKRRTQSVNRHHEIEFSKTVEGKEVRTPNTFFNELYSKVRNRLQLTGKEQKPLRKGKFETLDDQRARSQQAGELSMYKISFTNVANPQGSRSQQQVSEESQKQAKKNNFRRNKYEAVSQEVERKDCNLETNINMEMDRLAARQNEPLIQARNRELHGSIEKSTDKYFNHESYRPIRSKNQIELYVSAVPNPPLHKASHSTNEKSDCQNRLGVSSLKPQKANDQLLEYDFDFKNDEEVPSDHESDPESSVFTIKGQDEFQKQRKKVELEFFHKAEPHLDWSEDQCKIDDIM